MIKFHRVCVPEDPAAAAKAVDLLTEIFGQEEGALEQRQLSGDELAENADTLLYAEEDGRTLGTCHMTYCRETGHGGLSGLCVRPECRGGGVGKTLFGMAVDAFDETGGEYLYLGTSNAAAARIYRGFGFAFEAGSNVMYRTKRLSLLSLYGKDMRLCSAEDATDSLRIGMIPLALRRGEMLIKDANTGLADNGFFTQLSCMGLYPKYLAVLQRGGTVKVVKDEATRLPAALGSAVEIGGRRYADVFGVDEAAGALPVLLDALCGEGACYARILDGDAAKRALFAAAGFAPAEETKITVNGILIPCRLWRRG